MPYKNNSDKLAYLEKKRKSGRAYAIQKAWYAKNPDKYRAIRRREYLKIKADPDKARKRQEGAKKLRTRNRLKAIELYGSHCECCNESKVEFLAFDHINGDGSRERRIRSQSVITRLIGESRRTDIRLLCHNCNLSIGFYGTCPHQGFNAV